MEISVDESELTREMTTFVPGDEKGLMKATKIEVAVENKYDLGREKECVNGYGGILGP
jgi:hypothetical protein